jgi:hypothetical protein
MYQKHDEKIDYITTACSVLVKEEKIKRQERVRAQLPLKIRKEIGVKEEKERWYKHVLKLGETSRDQTYVCYHKF